MKKMNRGYLIATVLLTVISGCKDDPASPPENVLPTARGVYIVNEGLFGQGNASLSYLDFDSGQMENGVFQAANGRALGDVGNHIVVRNGTAYIVVNNSHKVEIIETQTHRSLGTIDAGAGTSPRQLALASDTLGLLTNLYDASVSVLGLGSQTVIGRIPVGTNPEGIAISSGTAFVANSGFGSGNTVTVIDLSTLTAAGSIVVADNPADVVRTSDGKIYVLCAGAYGDFNDPNDDTPAKIMVIEPSSRTVVDSILIGGHAFRMSAGKDNEVYVVAETSVLQINTQTHAVVGPFVPGTYYGVGVEEESGDVYIADARDFVTPGRVLAYSPGGAMINEHTVGLIPGRLAFNR
jgi:YVTN family beta-propeller protein